MDCAPIQEFQDVNSALLIQIAMTIIPAQIIPAYMKDAPIL
jgi:hypothetical protein